MTLWRHLTQRPAELPVSHHRMNTPDDDFVDLLRLDAEAAAPRLLVLHGLEGSARSRYVSALFDEMRKRKWGMDLLLFRSCSQEENHAARFYHSGETGDLDFVVRELLRAFPQAELALAGFSLGGNVLLKWLGEQGEGVPPRVKAAAAVSVPFDLARSADRIGSGFSRIYEHHFLRSLKRKAISKGGRYPELRALQSAAGATTLRQFDDTVTAPLHGFRDATDYYTQSSSLQYLARIRVPTLLLSAKDDPFLPAAVLESVVETATSNPALSAEFVNRGGHVGFVAGRWPWRVEYYAERRVADFCAQHVAQTASPRDLPRMFTTSK